MAVQVLEGSVVQHRRERGQGTSVSTARMHQVRRERLAARSGGDVTRAKKINSADDLTLGNYGYVLDDDERWAKLRWPYERADMVDRLRKVASYRNAIAHWDIDAPGQGSDELTHAKQVLRILKVIDRDPTE